MPDDTLYPFECKTEGCERRVTGSHCTPCENAWTVGYEDGRDSVKGHLQATYDDALEAFTEAMADVWK